MDEPAPAETDVEQRRAWRHPRGVQMKVEFGGLGVFKSRVYARSVERIGPASRAIDELIAEPAAEELRANVVVKADRFGGGAHRLYPCPRRLPAHGPAP